MTADERGRRIGKNEAMFREVNERIEGVTRRFGVDGDMLALVCECGDVACADQVILSSDDYGLLRSEPRHFVVVDGHEKPSVERVVRRGEGYVFVEKRDGAPSRLAERTDPRS